MRAVVSSLVCVLEHKHTESSCEYGVKGTLSELGGGGDGGGWGGVVRTKARCFSLDSLVFEGEGLYRTPTFDAMGYMHGDRIRKFLVCS